MSTADEPVPGVASRGPFWLIRGAYYDVVLDGTPGAQRVAVPPGSPVPFLDDVADGEFRPLLAAEPLAFESFYAPQRPEDELVIGVNLPAGAVGARGRVRAFRSVTWTVEMGERPEVGFLQAFCFEIKPLEASEVAAALVPWTTLGAVWVLEADLTRHHVGGMVVQAGLLSCFQLDLSEKTVSALPPRGARWLPLQAVWSLGDTVTEADLADGEVALEEDPDSVSGTVRLGHRTHYISDNGQRWTQPPPTTISSIPRFGPTRHYRALSLTPRAIKYIVEHEDDSRAIIMVHKFAAPTIEVIPAHGEKPSRIHAGVKRLERLVSLPDLDSVHLRDDAPDCLRVGARHRVWVSDGLGELTFVLPTAENLWQVLVGPDAPVDELEAEAL